MDFFEQIQRAVTSTVANVTNTVGTIAKDPGAALAKASADFIAHNPVKEALHAGAVAVVNEAAKVTKSPYLEALGAGLVAQDSRVTTAIEKHPEAALKVMTGVVKTAVGVGGASGVADIAAGVAAFGAEYFNQPPPSNKPTPAQPKPGEVKAPTPSPAPAVVNRAPTATRGSETSNPTALDRLKALLEQLLAKLRALLSKG